MVEEPNPIHHDLERIRVSVETGLQQLRQLLDNQDFDGTRVRLCLCDDARAVAFGPRSYCTLEEEGEGLELTLHGSQQRFVLRGDDGRELSVPHGRWASMASAGTDLAMVGTPDMCRLRTLDGAYLCLQEDTGFAASGFGAVREGSPALWCLQRL